MSELREGTPEGMTPSCRALRLTRKGDRLAIVLKLSRYAARHPKIWRVKGTDVNDR